MKGHAVLIVVGFLLAACERNSEIKVYRVSKAPLEESGTEPQMAMPTNAASPPMPGGMAPASGSSVSVSTPPNWEPQPLSQMRQASFLVKGDQGSVADISFVGLGPAAGNVLDNVNRWLGQLEQSPVDETKLQQMSDHLSTSQGEATIVDLQGLPKGADPAKDGRIIAAIIPAGGTTLFFKMRGNAELVASQKTEFVKWVAAVCNGQTGTKSSSTAEMPPPDSAKPEIKWSTPDGWKEVPPSSMRYASFAAGANEGNVDVSIVTFPGDGGADADNINRWRRQIGLSPVDVFSNIGQLKSGENNFSTIDLNGNNGRTIAAWIRRDSRVWFIKATGPSAAVEKEKARFESFVRSIKF